MAGIESLRAENPVEQVDQPKQEEAIKQDPKKGPDGYEKKVIKGLSAKDRLRVDRGETSISKVVEESHQIKEQAERLLSIAEKTEKISKDEAKNIKKTLKETDSKEQREKILFDIQEKIASTGTSTVDKKQELKPDNPEIQKAFTNYDRLLDENKHLFGTNSIKEYKKWIRGQKLTLENIEQLTVKLLQSELPPRQEKWAELKKTLNKHGVKNPLEISYIEQEGLSERQAFLKNIQSLETFFSKQGDLKQELYTDKAEETFMQEICRAQNPQEQKYILDRTRFIEKAEADNYTTLNRAVGAEKISRKSMKNILDYYKKIAKWGDRLENMNLWDNFIENETKLGDKLKEVFNTEPKNEEGYKLSYRIFKDLDFVGKEKFIEKTKKQRETEKNIDEQNKQLAIETFKHECEKASEEKTISRKTAENYKKWIDDNAKNKPYKEVKQFLDILTSPTPNEKYKNLKSYEVRRKKYKDDLKKLEDISPQLEKKDIDKWQEDYDKEGWKKREEQQKKLRTEIQKNLDAKTKERLDKAGPETAKGKESKEKIAQQSKETAMQAIKDLADLKAFGTAMKRCSELLRANPYDTEVQKLFDEIAKQADGRKEQPDIDKEETLYRRFSKLSKEFIKGGDGEMKLKADEMQTEDTALRMMEESMDRHHGTLKAKDRATKELHEKTRTDDETQSLTDDYLKSSKDNKVLDETSLKGRETIQFNLHEKLKKEDATKLRRDVQKEQAKNKEHHGGSAVIEFKQRKGEEKVLDRRQARVEHTKREEALADELVDKITRITHPGKTPSTAQKILAKKAALESLREREEERIERMSESK